MLADRKGPRFNARKYRKKIVTRELYKKWKDLTGHNLNFDTFKKIWKLIALQMQELALEDPDGIQLPEAVGTIYIGYINSRKRAIDYNISRRVSAEAGKEIVVYYDNFHTNGKIGKIIYSACGKYRLRTCMMWSFKPITPFEERTTKAFNENPERYKHSRQKKYGPNSRPANFSAGQSDEISTSRQQDDE